jgi:hypothetical protein
LLQDHFGTPPGRRGRVQVSGTVRVGTLEG